MKTIGSIIKRVMNEKGMSVPVFADKIHRAIRTCYNIFDNNDINVALLRDISIALDHDFFKDLSENYDLAKPIEVDESRRQAVGQFMSVMPNIFSDLKYNGQIITCFDANFDEDFDFPIPDFIIEPSWFMVTIGESFEDRCKRYDCDKAFKFTTISDETGTSVILCYNFASHTHSINIILDYKTKEEWRNVLELAIVTSDKYYNDMTKFLNDNPKVF